MLPEKVPTWRPAADAGPLLLPVLTQALEREHPLVVVAPELGLPLLSLLVLNKLRGLLQAAAVHGQAVTSGECHRLAAALGLARAAGEGGPDAPAWVGECRRFQADRSVSSFA